MDMRIVALENAVQIADASAKPEDIVATAESFYAFLASAGDTDEKPKTTRTRKPKDETPAAVAEPAAETAAVEKPAEKPPLDAGNATAAASETPAQSTTPVPPSDDLKTAAMKFSQANGHDAFVAALAKYGAAKLSEVPTDKRDALLADLSPAPNTGGAFD